jgi:hypothetical protein
MAVVPGSDMQKTRGHGGSVSTSITYVRRGMERDAMLNTSLLPPDMVDEHIVSIADARPDKDELSLERNGFVLRKHVSAVTDFYDQDQQAEVYGPEMQAFLGSLFAARKLVQLEHLIRGPKDLRDKKPDYEDRLLGHAVKAHLDGDERTYREWAANLMPAQERALFREAPFAVYNIWRPIEPVEEKPLAFCDGASLDFADLVPVRFDIRQTGEPNDHHYPVIDYFHLAFNPAHRWYYFAQMQPDEVVVFKQWDTRKGEVMCVPHSAFVDPSSQPGARPRTSIEIRFIAFF